MVRIIFDMPDLYETKEAADMIGIGYATLFRWIKSGKLMPIKVDRRTLIPKSEIERLRRDKATDALSVSGGLVPGGMKPS